MKELEKLLNSLIQRGWKPWGEKSKKIIIRASRIFVYNSEWYVNPEGKHIRELVSLESWLWQFVCENKMCKNQTSVYRWYKKFWSKEEEACRGDHYEYRLLESALIPEKELAQFLVDNIKVE